MTIIEGTEILFEISGETLILSGKGKIPSYSKEEYEAEHSEWLSNYPSENETFPDFRESPWKDKKSIIKKIIIGEGIFSIGNEAFDSMVALEDVTFPASILEIGDSAFRNCTSLRRIELPCNLEFIGNSAFAGCSLLEYISIPIYVRKIEYSAFVDDDQLKIIDCEMASNIWGSISEVFERRGALWSLESKYEYRQCPPYVPENTTVVFSEDKGILPLKIDPETGLLKYCQRGAIGDIEVPDYVTGIAELAFSQCKKLKKIVLHGDISVIPSNCFRDCEELEAVVLSSSITVIQDYAFMGCSMLESVNLPSYLECLGRGVFWGCKSLPQICLPESLSKIGDHCFFECENLRMIRIPSKIEEIPWDAFRNCLNLAEIILPSKVPGFAIGAFERCPIQNVLIYGNTTKQTRRSLRRKARNGLFGSFVADNSDSSVVFDQEEENEID